MMPGEYFDSTYTHWGDPGSGRMWPKPEKMDWGGNDYNDDLRYLQHFDSRYKEHGAVPENLKQSYLSDMLDYYGNTNIQHGLVPEEYTDTDELENVRARGAGKPLTYNMFDKTRYVEAPDQQFYGHTGPDYITMMNIMKAQNDPNFDVGFMSEEYMKNKYRQPTADWTGLPFNDEDLLPGMNPEDYPYGLNMYGGKIDGRWSGPKPRVGGYYQGRDQAIALNPYDMLDFSDPNVDKAFSLGAGKPRTLEDLEGTSLQIGEGTKPWNLNVLSHELGHAYTQYPWNRGKYKFNMPNISTSNINMTQSIPDTSVMGTPGHNEAYWIGRAHDDRWRDRDMNLTAAAAENIRDWTSEARNYIDRANQPRSIANEPMPVGATRFGTPNFAPSNTTPSRPRHPHFNTGGLASLML
tara:strand:- start:28 stop:1251 length:1224 start_codon:yes stop_codon:yes gene_type:complete